MSTFKKSLAELKPSVFLVEETKYREEGKLKIDGNYTIFESVRKSRDWGGWLIGWLREGEENVEALSVETSFRE